MWQFWLSFLENILDWFPEGLHGDSPPTVHKVPFLHMWPASVLIQMPMLSPDHNSDYEIFLELSPSIFISHLHDTLAPQICHLHAYLWWPFGAMGTQSIVTFKLSCFPFSQHRTQEPIFAEVGGVNSAGTIKTWRRSLCLCASVQVSVCFPLFRKRLTTVFSSALHLEHWSIPARQRAAA